MASAENSGKESKFTFQWTVANVHMFGVLEGKEIASPKFTVSSLDNTEWYLKLLPNTDYTNKSVLCFLHRTDSGPESIKISFSLSENKLNSVEHQTFGRNSSSCNPGIIDVYEFAHKLDQSFSKDVSIECCLWQRDSEFFRRRNAPESPYPVFCSARTVVSCEQRKFLFPVKNFTTRFERSLIASVCVDSAGSSYPKLVCELWKVSYTTSGHDFFFRFRKPEQLPSTPTVVKYRIRLVDGLERKNFLFERRFIFNDDHDTGVCLISEQKLREMNVCEPDAVMVFSVEVAFSDNSYAGFLDSVRYDSSDVPADNLVPGWGMYLDHKYNEHRFLFRLLVVLVFIVSLLIPHLFTDNSL